MHSEHIKALWYAQDLNSYGASTTLRVLSIHEHVINLQAAEWPHLLIITDPYPGKGPASIGLGAKEFTNLKGAISERSDVRYQPELACFSGDSKEMPVSWAGRPALSFAPPAYLDDRPDTRRSAVSSYLTWFKEVRAASAAAVLFDLPGPDEYFRREIKAWFPALVAALATGDKKDFQDICRNLIGMGRGATPTGDDLIYGALLASCYRARMRLVEWQQPVYPDSSLEKTTYLGRHMLEMGRKGLAPEAVRSFLLSLYSGKAKRGTMQRLLAIGSSTGYDIIAAILFFMKTDCKIADI